MDIHGFQALRFSQIEHRLPADCWARARNTHNQGEFAEEMVLYHPGDASLALLDLDDPLGQAGAETAAADRERVFLIMVEGDLSIAGHLGNEETDGATGLVVTGDLEVGDAIVGGQQIYVCGDFAVHGLFWGDYNHGTLTVRGDAQAGLFMATNEYHVEIDGARAFLRELNDDGTDDTWQLLDTPDFARVFGADAVIESDGEPVLRADRLLARLRAGRPAYSARDFEELIGAREIPSLFADDRPGWSNLRRLTALSLMPQADQESASRYEFWSGDLFCRASSYLEENEAHMFRMAYFQDEAGHVVRFRADAVQGKRNLWSRLLGKSAGSAPKWSANTRLISSGDGEWSAFDAASAQPFHRLAHKGWTTLLQGASTYAHARTLIAADDFRGLLALPLVQPYDDFYDEDRLGLWLGNVFCAFRQQGALFDGEPRPALLRVDRRYIDGQGQEKTEDYFFTLQRHQDGSECILIEYKADEDLQGRIPLSYLGGPRLWAAVRMFKRARRNLLQANEELLQGVAPNCEDVFALRYWRNKGYIRTGV